MNPNAAPFVPATPFVPTTPFVPKPFVPKNDLEKLRTLSYAVAENVLQPRSLAEIESRLVRHIPIMIIPPITDFQDLLQVAQIKSYKTQHVCEIFWDTKRVILVAKNVWQFPNISIRQIIRHHLPNAVFLNDTPQLDLLASHAPAISIYLQ